MALKKVIIDDREVEVPGTLTLIQACEDAGVEIPRFCYHDRLSIAGNCRMCLVEVKGAPKPMASCAVAVNDLRPGPNGEPPVISTRSDMVKKAREGVMEFLLANHPLDCPICDQGGECDLQDQAMAYGTDKSRFVFNKRAVDDKDLGPLVKTVMTRCIHCTRCVRFSTEVAGAPELGAVYRGEDTEITPYLENIVTSELSANIIDLCPVGALTSKPYAFRARPWEVKRTDTYDVMDAMGAAITVHARGNEVLRITPRNDDDVNEEWISNKTRFVVDGLRRQRLDKPYMRVHGKLQPAAWEDALAVVADKLKIAGTDTAFIAGPHSDVETLFAAQNLAEKFGAFTEGRRHLQSIPADNIALSRFNSEFAAIDRADVIILIGTNPRFEAPVLNARIRKAWLQNNADIAVIGETYDLTYDYQHLGAGASTLTGVLDGTDKFADILKEAQRPVIIIGENVIAKDGLTVPKLVQDIIEKYDLPETCYNLLPSEISAAGVFELGFASERSVSDAKIIVSLGAEEFPADQQNIFKIYIGAHGDKGASQADVILPTAAYTEKDATYITAEGRVRQAMRAIFPPGQAKESWAILRALSAIAGKTLPFDSFGELREQLYAAYPQLEDADLVIAHDCKKIDLADSPTCELYQSHIKEFYLTDSLARASKVLRECQDAFYNKNSKPALGGTMASAAL
ncbi:MAG: NADH-quinone oxidoreductase subunit NuoG [Pseudomonadota bacterium]